jgi:hypothetical protein
MSTEQEVKWTAEWQTVGALPVTADPPPGKDFPDADEYLLWSPKFGRRTARVYNWRGHIHGSIANLHGCAFKDWGATHWMRLPPPPARAEGST